MQGRDGAIGRDRYRYFGPIIAVAIFGVLTAGCTTIGGTTTASLQPARNATIAFEMIDGPPPAIFNKLVQKLGEEAQARQVPVVTREGFASYRIRGYVAAGLERKKKRIVISWVWDVYDANEQRTFRAAGEEQVARTGGDAWAAASDEVLGRIAHNGMTELANYLQLAPPEKPDNIDVVAMAKADAN